MAAFRMSGSPTRGDARPRAWGDGRPALAIPCGRDALPSLPLLVLLGLLEVAMLLAKHARVLVSRCQAVVRTLRSMAMGLFGDVCSGAVAWGLASGQQKDVVFLVTWWWCELLPLWKDAPSVADARSRLFGQDAISYAVWLDCGPEELDAKLRPVLQKGAFVAMDPEVITLPEGLVSPMRKV